MTPPPPRCPDCDRVLTESDLWDSDDLRQNPPKCMDCNSEDVLR